MESISSNITQGLKDLGSSIVNNIKSFFGITNNKIEDNTNTVSDGFSDTQEQLDTNFSALYEDMDYATNEIINGFEKSVGGIEKLDNNFVYYQDGTIKTIEQYKNDFNEYVDSQAYMNDYSNLDTENSKNGNDSASDTINNGVNSITDKFSFYNDVKDNVNDMINVITDTDSVPKFYLNISSKYYSGQICILDLSWYAPFKEYGDTIICIFCYLTFLWNIFIRLPDIIGGAGASSFSANMIDDITTYNKTGFSRTRDFHTRGRF